MKTGIKMRVTPEQSRKVQEIVFSYGGTWGMQPHLMPHGGIHILSISKCGEVLLHDDEDFPLVPGEEVDADVFIAEEGYWAHADGTTGNSSTCQAERGAGLKYDAGKLRYSLVPTEALRGLAEVLTFGAEKYEPNSWQEVENAEERYLDALIRHIEAYRSGEALDQESGLHHLKHAACNVAFLIYFEETSARRTD
jgi:hypothetical protein